jgi:hypothetical protein
MKAEDIHAVRASNLTSDTQNAKTSGNIDFHPKLGDRDQILTDEEDNFDKNEEVKGQDYNAEMIDSRFHHATTMY